MREMLGTSGRVVAIDGKAICSTASMKTTHALHILTAYLTENGVTLGQVNVHEKTNKIPLMQDLLQMIQVKGKVVTADAMHCQTETCAKIIEAEGDYLLPVKGNQPDLLDIFMDDMIKTDVNALDYAQTVEKNRGRHEERTCYVSSDVDWFNRKQAWQGLRQFAAIKRLVRKDDKETVEWHYYITSVGEEAEKILLYARDHWKIESMHWQLDVTFSEDDCRIISAQTQQSLNIFRKLALALQKNYLEGHRHLKGYKRKAMSANMFDCLLKDSLLLDVIKM